MKLSLILALVLASAIAYGQSRDYTEKKKAELVGPSPFIAELSGQAKDRIIYDSNQVLAFHSNKPQAPVHIIVIPKKRIATLNDLTPSDSSLVSEMIFTATKLAASNGVAETGYRLVFNTNEHAGQSAFHIHLHLLGGMSTGPMVDQQWRKQKEETKQKP
jgi:histidine triad (HIT) family protein